LIKKEPYCFNKVQKYKFVMLVLFQVFLNFHQFKVFEVGQLCCSFSQEVLEVFQKDEPAKNV